MAKIYAAPYSIRIREKYSKAPIKFNNVFKGGILNEVNKFLLSLQAKFRDDPNEQTILRILQTTKHPSQHWINGIVETGAYGYESKFYDKNGNHKYNRQKDHAETMPFYFLLGIDGKMDVGLIILQRYGQYGISNLFIKSLKDYLKTVNTSIAIDIEPIVSDKVLHQFVNSGEIKKVTFNKFQLPSDLASEFSSRRKKKDFPGYMQLNIIAKKNEKLNLNKKLNSIIFGTSKARLLNVKDFDFDETKVLVEYNGVKRTISFGDYNFRAFYDVSADVEREPSDYPTFNSIDKISKEIMTEMFELLTK